MAAVAIGIGIIGLRRDGRVVAGDRLGEALLLRQDVAAIKVRRSEIRLRRHGLAESLERLIETLPSEQRVAVVEMRAWIAAIRSHGAAEQALGLGKVAALGGEDAEHLQRAGVSRVGG